MDDFVVADLINAKEEQDESHHMAASDSSSKVKDFVELVEHTPAGKLSNKEAILLRELLTSAAADTNNSGDDSSARVAERLLYRMLEEWEAAMESNNKVDYIEFLQPTTKDFLLVMHAWEATLVVATTRAGRKKSTALVASHVWELFLTMEDLCENGVVSVQPNEKVFHVVMRVLSHSRERGADRKARSVFDGMKKKYACAPSAEVYGSLITTLAKSRERGAANRSESFLREAAERFPPSLDEVGKQTGITIDSFNVVITAWAKSMADYAPERAEKLIIYMDDVDRKNGGHGLVRPNVTSFTSLLDAYAQKLDWDSVSQAERIFNRLLDQYLEGEIDIEPNIATWTIVLSAWAKLSRKRNRGAAPRADRLMRRMEELHAAGRISFGPDAIAYVSLMNAWAFSKADEGPEKAQELLTEMYERYLDGDDTMEPTAKSIRVVLEGWIKSNAVDAMQHAEKLLDIFEDHLDTMQDSASQDGGLRSSVSKDVSDVYETMLVGWARHGRPQQAQEYLMDMVERKMHFDSACFDRIIEANTRTDDPDAMKRTQAIFELMEDCRQKGLLEPSERVYTSFIRAMAKAHVPKLAHNSNVLLKRMDDLSRIGNNTSLRPTVFTYNAVLRACAESDGIEGADSLEAFKIAIQVFNELRSLSSKQQELGPDHVSFGNMLSCAPLIPDGEQKDALIRSTFQLCCRSGYVNNLVLRDLRSVASRSLWEQVLRCPPETEVGIDQLPASWSRRASVKQQRKNDAR